MTTHIHDNSGRAMTIWCRSKAAQLAPGDHGPRENRIRWSVNVQGETRRAHPPSSHGPSPPESGWKGSRPKVLGAFPDSF